MLPRELTTISIVFVHYSCPSCFLFYITLLGVLSVNQQVHINYVIVEGILEVLFSALESIVFY